MDKLEKANEIIEFWRKTELFTQENLKTESYDNKSKVKKELREVESKGEMSTKKLVLYHELSIFTDFNVAVSEDKRRFKCKEEVENEVVGSECLINIGKVKRKECVEKLNELLGIEDDVEGDRSNICCITLKVSNQGEYIQKSLQISPILWGISVLQEFEEDAASYLNLKCYADACICLKII
ncbi:MAG: hypothetical protein NC412_01625 [Roseburia sp.]|nr:hypothetical protein [Roseburia sp.]MCM1277957.1 hypothetical protein [Robinsoniella sp.]